MVDVACFGRRGREGIEVSAAGPATVTAVDSDDDVAVTVPGEGGVEHDGLPVVGCVVAVAVGH